MRFSFLLYINHSQRKFYEGSTQANQQLKVMNQSKRTDGSTEYHKINREPISELDAAMHYIDFQKENWLYFIMRLIYRLDLFELRKKVLVEQYLEYFT